MASTPQQSSTKAAKNKALSARPAVTTGSASSRQQAKKGTDAGKVDKVGGEAGVSTGYGKRRVSETVKVAGANKDALPSPKKDGKAAALHRDNGVKSARVKRRVISDSEDEAYEESAKETIPPLRKKVARTVTATKSCGSNSRDRPLALGAEGDKQVKAVATKRGIAKPVGSTIRKAPAGLPSSTKTGAAKISKSTRSTSTARPPSEGEEGEEDEDGGNDAAAAAKPIRVTASKAVNVNKQLVKASRISGSGSEAPAARPSLKRKRSTLEQDCPDTVTSEPAGLQPLRGRVVIANTSTDRASAQSKFDDDASAPMPRGTGTVEARSSHPARVTGPDRFKPTDYGTTSKKLADRANLRNIIKSKAVTLNLGASEMTAPTPAARKAARKPINLPVEPNPYTPGKVFKPSRGPQHEYPAPPPDGGLRPPIRRGVHVHGRTPPTLVGNWFDGRAGLRNFN